MLIERAAEHMRGESLIETRHLLSSSHHEVYYLPHVENGNWGIFDKNDRPVELAIERGFTELSPLRQIPQSNVNFGSLTARVDDGFEYVYGGRFVPHFGHFIIETLARFWPYLDGFTPRQRIVFHGDGRPAAWFASPHVKTFFEALGISQEIIVHSDTPFRIPNLIVNEPSFRPQARGFREFASLCRAIGRRIQPDLERIAQRSRPIYFSKTRLKSGVALWHHEKVLEDYLACNGVEIVHPQELSVKEHISLFASRVRICGVVGSAHHVCLFAGKGAQMTLLSPEKPNSNFRIIDLLNENQTTYLYPTGTNNVAARTGRFIVEREIHAPLEVAKALLARL